MCNHRFRRVCRRLLFIQPLNTKESTLPLNLVKGNNSCFCVQVQQCQTLKQAGVQKTVTNHIYWMARNMNQENGKVVVLMTMVKLYWILPPVWQALPPSSLANQCHRRGDLSTTQPCLIKWNLPHKTNQAWHWEVHVRGLFHKERYQNLWSEVVVPQNHNLWINWRKAFDIGINFF
jgi:hypothetical protein